MTQLLNKLEAFKKLGLADVQLYYGAEDGLDCAVPMLDRVIKITGTPVQFYGKVKLLWTGRVHELAQMDFKQRPTVLIYPVNLEDMTRAEQNGGWFVFGEEKELKQFLNYYTTTWRY